MTGPALPDVGLLGLVPGRWGGLWMGRHQLLTRLAAYFHVVWVNPATEWRAAWLPGRRPARLIFPAPPPAIPGFVVFEPGRFRPLVYRPAWLARATERARLAAARDRLARRGVRRVILSVWRPELASAIDLVPHDVSCYHVADEYTFSAVDLPTPPHEAAILRRVDQVIAHSEALLEKKRGLNRHTDLVPNGVDYEAFATPQPEPDDLRAVPRPRIGWVGFIKEQLDLARLARLARARPDWHFVFVGPVRDRGDVREAVRAFQQLPNAHFLGPRPTARLPAYIQGLDVGIMCYVEDGYTPYISPLKLHEYLAAGLPVVATPIRSVRPFADVVRLAREDADWTQALNESLAPSARAAAAREARRVVARGFDWNLLAERVAALLCARLGPEYSARLESLAIHR